jgi:hypothetical protein
VVLLIFGSFGNFGGSVLQFSVATSNHQKQAYFWWRPPKIALIFGKLFLAVEYRQK